MTKKDFRFWLTFIVLIGLSCQAAFYYKHHMIVNKRVIAAQEAVDQRMAALASGPVTSKKFTRADFPVTLSATGEVSINKSDATYADVSFTLPEENFDDVEEGQEITFVVDELPNVFFKGEVYAMDDADSKTHEFNVKAMANNSDDNLKPDMTAQVEMVVDVHQNALVIPESAIINKDNQDFVYLIEEGNAKLTPVTIGVHQDNMVEITSGAIEDKDIIVSGTDHIQDGASVTLEEAKPVS